MRSACHMCRACSSTGPRLMSQRLSERRQVVVINILGSELRGPRNGCCCRRWVAASHSLYLCPVGGRPCPAQGCHPHRAWDRLLPNPRPNLRLLRRAHPRAATEPSARVKERRVKEPGPARHRAAGTVADPDRDHFQAGEVGQRSRIRREPAATKPPEEIQGHEPRKRCLQASLFRHSQV